MSTGYNGPPRGEDNCCDIYEECPRKNVPHNSGNYGDCRSVHAEQNAIINASREELQGGIIYISGEEYNEEVGSYTRLNSAPPCPICERIIKNSGIVQVKYKNQSCVTCKYHRFSDFYLECDHSSHLGLITYQSENNCEDYERETSHE